MEEMKRGETQRRHTFIKYIGITVLALLVLVNIAGASTRVYAAHVSSFPNPSFEGQPITFNASIDLYNSNTMEIFPAPQGSVIILYENSPLGGGPVSNGVATVTVDGSSLSHLNIGITDLIPVYSWTDGANFTIIDSYLPLVKQEILPYIKSVEVSSSPNPSIEGQPVTLTAKFNFEDVPETYSAPNIQVMFDDDLQREGYAYCYPENGIATLTIPSMCPGTHHIGMSYTYSFDYSSNYNSYNTDFKVRQITQQVNNAVSVLPVANFSNNVTEGYAPLSVQFTDLSENATEWNWDFGDGATLNEQSPVHTYSVAGNYTVNLTVSNANGTASKFATINVSTQPVLPIFPGYTNPPKDLDQDVLYEDINGNGILDFDDVVAYYDNMDWIDENVPLEFFDYNNNGLIDFDDVVNLYDML